MWRVKGSLHHQRSRRSISVAVSKSGERLFAISVASALFLIFARLVPTRQQLRQCPKRLPLSPRSVEDSRGGKHRQSCPFEITAGEGLIPSPPPRGRRQSKRPGSFDERTGDLEPDAHRAAASTRPTRDHPAVTRSAVHDRRHLPVSIPGQDQRIDALDKRTQPISVEPQRDMTRPARSINEEPPVGIDATRQPPNPILSSAQDSHYLAPALAQASILPDAEAAVEGRISADRDDRYGSASAWRSRTVMTVSRTRRACSCESQRW